jgi:hypothetical protein
MGPQGFKSPLLPIVPPYSFVILSASEGSPDKGKTHFQIELSVKQKTPEMIPNEF